ncbi:MAG: hypothetical protein ACRCZF_09175 [Gemmataceae bacterium]
MRSIMDDTKRSTLLSRVFGLIALLACIAWFLRTPSPPSQTAIVFQIAQNNLRAVQLIWDQGQGLNSRTSERLDANAKGEYRFVIPRGQLKSAQLRVLHPKSSAILVGLLRRSWLKSFVKPLWNRRMLLVRHKMTRRASLYLKYKV